MSSIYKHVVEMENLQVEFKALQTVVDTLKKEISLLEDLIKLTAKNGIALTELIEDLMQNIEIVEKDSPIEDIDIKINTIPDGTKEN